MRDVPLPQLLFVRLSPPNGKQAGMDPRMKCLHPAIQDLRETGVGRNLTNRDACVQQEPGRPSGGYDLHLPFSEKAREIEEPVLIEDTDECMAYSYQGTLPQL
jgi:hypothetical protein